jgi:hypothetical protein
MLLNEFSSYDLGAIGPATAQARGTTLPLSVWSSAHRLSVESACRASEAEAS